MVVARGTALPFPLPSGLRNTDTDPAPDPDPDPTVTVTAQQLADESGAAIARATRVLPVATQAVTDYAPDAPEPLQNEAVLRFGGYLLGSGYGEVRSKSIGPLSVEHVVNHAAAFRNSGAAALLTRHKVRRAGAIG